jgi:alkaline phosphatase D
MKIFKRSIIALALLCSLTLILLACIVSESSKKDTYVVMLSLDAYRWDYPDLTSTPNLHAIASNGVRANALIPCFPSKTFPNHYSMATGLHPDHHGIVCNNFYDSTLGYYSIGDRKAVGNSNFYGGEPIWVTAEKQGIISASYFWVGTETQIKGHQPTYWKKYNQKTPFEDRIDTVIHWLSLPIGKRPRFITWYSHEPDWTSHDYGPTGAKTLAMASKLDSLIGVFMIKLSKLPHADKINFIVVSDHGMADISSERYINLSDYVSKDLFDIITGGNPVYSLKPKADKKAEALAKLKAIPNLKVWEKHELPARYVYGKNSRINDIVIEAELGYSVGWSFKSEPYSGGTHGYDNQYPEMHGIFFAQGPAFAKGIKHEAFSNTNLYGIIAHILGLKPEPTDGNLQDVKGLFSKEFVLKDE